MAKDIIGVVGCGAMGAGIAQLFAQAGHPVRLYDAADGAAAKALGAISAMFGKLAEKGRLSADEAAGATRRLTAVDALDALAGCAMIVEAIVENLDVKKTVFAALEVAVGPDAILASNTSSLTISAIAAACAYPERVVGLHFFNPVPLMKVAEVVPGIRTAPAVVEKTRALLGGTGHRAVVAADQPGFLVNHAGRAFYTEAFRIVEEQVADFATVDRVLKGGCGFRMGPFELLDLTGLDVSGKVMQSIFEQFQHDPRYRPSSLVPPRIAAGLHGRKTGAGFYTYNGGQPVMPQSDRQAATTATVPQGSVWFADDDVPRARFAVAGVSIADAPDGADVHVVSLLGEDVTAAALRSGCDPSKTIGLDPFLAEAAIQTLTLCPATRPEAVSLARAWLAAGSDVAVTGDSPGAIVQRVLAMIVNTGCEIAQRGIASPGDIDAAVRIGLGYPAGPLEWGDALGPTRVLQVLQRMAALTGDPRYRPSAWLRRRAALGISLATEQ